MLVALWIIIIILAVLVAILWGKVSANTACCQAHAQRLDKLEAWAQATAQWLKDLKAWINAGMPGGTDPGDPPPWV